MAKNNSKILRFSKGTLLGISLGLLVGILLGILFSGRLSHSPILVHATATHGQNNHALATGELNEDVELVAFLDPERSSLKAAVLNVRNYKFQVFYTRNISKDFPESAGKNRRYLMTTGRAVFNFQAGKRYARSVIYVTELNSGKCVAYGMQSLPNARSLHQKFYGKLIPLDQLTFPEIPLSGEETHSPEDEQDQS